MVKIFDFKVRHLVFLGEGKKIYAVIRITAESNSLTILLKSCN